MELLNDQLIDKINATILHSLKQGDFDQAHRDIITVLSDLYQEIPNSKRSSFGRFHTIKVLSRHLHKQMLAMDVPIFEITSKLFDHSSNEMALGVAIGILTACQADNPKKVLPYFKILGQHDHWMAREFAASFLSNLIQHNPIGMKRHLLELIQSDNPCFRRMACESLRPVSNNRWLTSHPEFTLDIVQHLFRESNSYPRTSVGNLLSDLARRHPEMIYQLAKQLVASGNKNSYWIAYRACRNLVKREPLRVMDLLKVDTYKYKQRIHRRCDYQRD